MIAEVRELVDQYGRWLREKTSLREVNGHVQITTPYLDRHNDHIQIYAQPRNGSYLLTDDGYTIGDLEMSGLSFSTGRRRQLLEQTLNGFGVQLNDEDLEISASRQDFSRKKHCLLQAMLAVNDLFCLAQPLVHSIFYEDVMQWMDLNDIRFTPKVKISGKSGYDHVFDFVVPKSRQSPERVIRAVNKPTRDTAESVAFAWIDTREVRHPDSKAYAILNDMNQPLPGTVRDALSSYGVKPVLWSERDKVREELAA